jgi:DNA-directed RNA polymerase specialized sigma24 family protein
MPAEESVTQWIAQLQAGDQAAAQALWERYFGRLVRLARQRLHGVRRAAADEEDVALSAFDSFCRAVENHRFPQLNDRDGLWRLLVVLTERKAVSLARAERRAKRGGGRVVGESGLIPPSSADDSGGLAALPGPEPTPDFAALMAEECERLLDRLEDDTLRRLVLLKLEGYANEEIAQRLGCALRTVERKLGLVRGRWENEVNP